MTVSATGDLYLSRTDGRGTMRGPVTGDPARRLYTWGQATMWRVVLTAAGVVFGGIWGFRLLLPPPPLSGEYQCGLSVFPAMLFGFPAGMVLGGLFSFVLLRAIENETRPTPDSRKRSFDSRDCDL